MRITLGGISTLAMAVFGALQAAAPPAPSRAAAESPAPTQPAQIIDRLEARLANVTDYECQLESQTLVEKKLKHATYRLWYRKPGLVRIKVEQGSHRGSQVSLTSKGKVRAKSGGVLGAFVMTMSKTDSRLKDRNGGYFWESDFGSMLRGMRQKLASAKQADVKPAGGDCQVITVVSTETSGKKGRVVWTVDPAQWLLLRSESFEDEQLVAQTEFRGYHENTGIDEEFFDR